MQKDVEKVAAKSVLIVDDHQSFLDILAAELGSDNKFHILTAENGQDALKVLESGRVDLVVTDLKMPVMNGFDLISDMKKKYPTIPIIVLSSFLYPESETRLRTLGISQYIDKNSLNFSTLEEMILRNWEGFH